MYWRPEPIWDEQDAYIIGGGTSLKTFDFALLKDKNTIGCNSAFILGVDICKVVCFGDYKWWLHYKKELESYTGMVVSNSPRAVRIPNTGILGMKRFTRGLGTDSLGWNGNTGAAAVNLALIFGAKRIFLLGFDMKLDKKGEANWYNKRYEKEKAEVYKRFLKGFDYVARDLPVKFPGREVINLTEDSNLKVFPKASIVEHFLGRR